MASISTIARYLASVPDFVLEEQIETNRMLHNVESGVCVDQLTHDAYMKMYSLSGIEVSGHDINNIVDALSNGPIPTHMLSSEVDRLRAEVQHLNGMLGNMMAQVSFLTHQSTHLESKINKQDVEAEDANNSQQDRL